MVDIFERNNGGLINVDATGHPITHTVVLYRGSTGVQVIDPSNFLYSSHLANTNFNGELTTQGLPQIETIHKKTQIYKPDASVGTGNTFDKYRDCTDVAVKLAFGLNVQPLTVFDERSVKVHPAVLHVSNNKDIDGEIIARNTPMRFKQTSSLIAQEDFAKVQHAIARKIDMLQQTTEKDALRQEYVSIVNAPSGSGILAHLIRLNDHVNHTLIHQLTDEHSGIVYDFQLYTMELVGALSDA